MQKFIIDPETMGPDGTTIVIAGQDARHIGRVLRLKPGDPVSMTDGRGRDMTGNIVRITRDRVEVLVQEQAQARSGFESDLDLIVCSAMLKDKKMDGIIRELTQLGVTSWVPFFSERSVPVPDTQKLARRQERWQSIARESLKQCRRSREVDIPFPLSFDSVLALAENASHRIAFWEESKTPLALEPVGQAAASGESFLHDCPGVKAVVLIGPEGGFTAGEIAKARTAGFKAYTLGPRILRAETAAVTAAALVQFLLGDLGKPIRVS